MTRINFLFNVGVLFLGIYLALVSGHGRLLDPIARSSAWRRDTRFPVYYNDNEMYCGGFGVQWEKNGGKCGICGENWAAKKLFEKGGSMYRGFSVRSYKEGQHIDVNVGITTNHLGWFEFRICNVDGMTTDATQDCLDKIVLKDANGVSKFPIPGRLYDFKTKLVLPPGLLCNKCVFQWKYLTGNSWGVDPKTGKGCMGCGPEQEQFYGCADVTITKDGSTTPEEPNNGNNDNNNGNNDNNNGNNENSNENNETNNGNNESSSEKCKAGDGYYADKSTQCKKFYYCSNSGTSSEKISYFECPAGLIFNAVGKFCDYAHNHDC